MKTIIKINNKSLDKQKKSLIKIINGRTLNKTDINNIEAILNAVDAIGDELHRKNDILIHDTKN